MSHDKPVWKSRPPSCPLYQVSSWYVVLPAWPVSLESTVEIMLKTTLRTPSGFRNPQNCWSAKFSFCHWTLTTPSPQASPLLPTCSHSSLLALPPTRPTSFQLRAFALSTLDSWSIYMVVWLASFRALLKCHHSKEPCLMSPIHNTPLTSFKLLFFHFFIWVIHINFQKFLMFTNRKPVSINSTSPSFSPWDFINPHSGPINLYTHLGHSTPWESYNIYLLMAGFFQLHNVFMVWIHYETCSFLFWAA